VVAPFTSFEKKFFETTLGNVCEILILILSGVPFTRNSDRLWINNSHLKRNRKCDLFVHTCFPDGRPPIDRWKVDREMTRRHQSFLLPEQNLLLEYFADRPSAQIPSPGNCADSTPSKGNSSDADRPSTTGLSPTPAA
jgi:hypothetical protein